MNSKGIALILVLALIMAVIALAAIGVGRFSSQSRFTHHKFSRIQAQYAAKAGIIYAQEMLRLGTWIADPPLGVSRFYCINDDGSMTCADGNFNDADLLPYRVEIQVWPQANSGTLTGTAQIDARVIY